MSLTVPSATTKRLADRLDEARPLIVVSFTDQISDAGLSAAAQDGLDVAEVRIDRFQELSASYVEHQLRRFASLPTIATIRTSDEGGDWAGDDAERLALFRATAPLVDAVDIELSSSSLLEPVATEAHSRGCMVIVSNHNFDTTPSSDQLADMVDRAKAVGADLVKLSAWVESEDEFKRLAEFTIEHSDAGLVVIAMGPRFGALSRVFFPAIGSRLTYAHNGHYAVSGQMDFQTTFQRMRQFYPAFNERKIVDLEILEGA